MIAHSPRAVRALALLCAVVVTATEPALGANQRAASIGYEFIDRPAGLPADFVAPPAVALRFLALEAIDGVRLEAALWEPAGRPPAATPIVIAVHGSGEHYSRGPVEILGKGLAARGFAVLGLRTRQHDANVNTDNFLDIRRDIEAAVYTARALGYSTLALHGHSLGNIQVQFYAATNWDRDIKAVILTGMFANLPWKSRHILIRNEANYRALHQAAMKAVADGVGGERLPIEMGWIIGKPVPVTAQHFLSYRWDQTSTADGTYWIKRIPRPILLVRDEGDQVVLPFEPYQLLTAATAAGSLVPGIKYVALPNDKGPNPDGHGFAANRETLADTVVAWLKEQGL